MITLDTALTAARQTLATVTERAERQGYYGGARTDIINSHAELRAALDMLVKAAEHNGIHEGLCRTRLVAGVIAGQALEAGVFCQTGASQTPGRSTGVRAASSVNSAAHAARIGMPRSPGQGLAVAEEAAGGAASGRVTAHTTLAAPSATGRPPPPMSVAVQPGRTASTRMRSRRSSPASRRVSAFSAALETL